MFRRLVHGLIVGVCGAATIGGTCFPMAHAVNWPATLVAGIVLTVVGAVVFGD